MDADNPDKTTQMAVVCLRLKNAAKNNSSKCSPMDNRWSET